MAGCLRMSMNMKCMVFREMIMSSLIKEIVLLRCLQEGFISKINIIKLEAMSQRNISIIFHFHLIFSLLLKKRVLIIVDQFCYYKSIQKMIGTVTELKVMDLLEFQIKLDTTQ